MNEKKLNAILKNKKELDLQVEFFIKKKLLFTAKFDEFELKGHLEKAKHNLRFVGDNYKLGYFDWVITGCYYAVYHAVLALILSRGYSSKNHDASLSVLIKEFYNSFLNEIEFVNKLFIDYNDVCFYVQSKTKRELASYSSSFIFSKEEVNEIIDKTIKFVNKSEEILENEN
jgi:uncharacterized protein (UPF0332 family)